MGKGKKKVVPVNEKKKEENKIVVKVKNPTKRKLSPGELKGLMRPDQTHKSKKGKGSYKREKYDMNQDIED